MAIKFCKKCGCDTERYASGDCQPCKINRDRKNKEKNSAYEKERRRRDPEATRARDAKYNANARGKEVAWRETHAEEIAAEKETKQALAAEIRRRHREETKELRRVKAAARHKAYYAENKERINARTSAYQKAHPEMAKKAYQKWWANNPRYSSEYYAKNKAAVAARSRKWRLSNADRSRSNSLRYRRENADRLKLVVAAWHKNNPHKVRAANHRRRAAVKNAEGYFSPSDVRAMMLDQKGRCVYCKTDISANYHLDHIHPLAKGGSNWPSNLQLLCPPCNLSKNDLDEAEFLRRKGYDLI